MTENIVKCFLIVSATWGAAGLIHVYNYEIWDANLQKLGSGAPRNYGGVYPFLSATAQTEG